MLSSDNILRSTPDAHCVVRRRWESAVGVFTVKLHKEVVHAYTYCRV